MMIDLTAPMQKYGDTPDITHMDLYYVGNTSPLTSLVSNCLVIDLSLSVGEVDISTIPSLDALKKGDSVILKTGWEQYRGTEKYAQSPSVDKKLIQFLVEKGVCMILIDSPGVYGGAHGQEHNDMDQYLADVGAFAVENLVNVHLLPVGFIKLFCFPINMTAQNNAPCRVAAEI